MPIFSYTGESQGAKPVKKYRDTNEGNNSFYIIHLLGCMYCKY